MLIAVASYMHIMFDIVYCVYSDVLVKMLMPNAVWRAGAVAATIRKVFIYI
jgi:hypothetical protein